MNRKITFLLFILFGINNLFAQVGIGTDRPKVTFDVASGAINNIPNGILIPRLTVEQLEQDNDSYTVEQHSTLVYVTSDLPGSTEKTKEVFRSGYYFYVQDTKTPIGIWRALGGMNIPEPTAIWVRNNENEVVKLALISTGDNRSSDNAISITDAGNLSIGKEKAHTNAILDIESFTKGVSFPNLTNKQRSSIVGDIPNGLTIYNIDENCFNYYDKTLNTWRSLCGTYPPAKFSLMDCSNPPMGPSSQLIVGQTLNFNDTYNVHVNITEPGTFEIIGRSTNGYSYIKTGTFTQIGTYVGVLEGQGIPIRSNLTPGDQLSFFLNGINVNTSCAPVIVNNSTTTFTVDCGSIVHGPGKYLKGQNVTNDNYIDVTINVITIGNINILTDVVNGVRFSSGTKALTNTGSQVIRLYASGVPTNIGAFSFNIPDSTPNGPTCPTSINVETNAGTFENPAESCDFIYNEGVRADGLYWIGSSSSNKYLTKCDMVDAAEAALFNKEIGGYTLLWSTSEKTTKDNGWWNNDGYMSMLNGWGRNVVTQKTGTLNINDFRIPSSERARWNGKETRLVVTAHPNDHNNLDVNNILNLNFIKSNLITGGNLTTGFYGSIVSKGYYMGEKVVITKNSTGDRHTINVNGEDIIGSAFLYVNSGYPFHWDLTTYGYYPTGMLSAAITKNKPILDGNWPTWVAGEYEAANGDEPFGYCRTGEVGTSKFWGNKHVSPAVSGLDVCIYSNSSSNVTPGTANGTEGKVMQWWAK